MAGRAGGRDGLALERARPGVAHIAFAGIVDGLLHVAVCAGEDRRVHAARAHVGFKLGVLHLDLRHAGARIGVVRKAHLVVVGEDGVGVHGGLAAVGQRHGLGLGVKVVFHMALRAGGGLCVQRREILAHGVGKIGVGDDELAAGIGVAVVAADALVDLGEHVLKGNGIRAHALVVHLGGEIGRFAGEAVGQLVRTACAGHILHRVVMAARTVVVLVEGHSLVHGGDHRVFLHMIHRGVVLRVLEVGGIHIGIGLRPAFRADHRDPRSRLGHGCRLGGRAEHEQTQNHQKSFFHLSSPFVIEEQRRPRCSSPVCFGEKFTFSLPHPVYRMPCTGIKG